MPEKINLAEKLSGLEDQWSPKIITRYNHNDIMVVKTEGEFVWHHHDDTDEFFLVLKGRIAIETEDGDVTLEQSELYVVPRGAKHRPVAHEETYLLLIEPLGTPNTGDAATAAQKDSI